MNYKLIVCGNPNTILSRTLFNVVKTLETSDIEVSFVDIEEEKDYVYKYSIRNSPTLLVFKDGQLWKKMNLPIAKENILV